MCGRFSFSLFEKIIEEYYNVSCTGYNPGFNCAPGQKLAVITSSEPDKLSFFQWGFLPSWIKPDMTVKKQINARSERVNERAMFRDEFMKNRCLIPADSFYEWSHDEHKTPYRVLLYDKPLFSMAGIWSEYYSAENEVSYSFAILTTDANDAVKPLHDRMPVILQNREEEMLWLSSVPENDLLSLLRPVPGNLTQVYPVSKSINYTSFNSIEAHREVLPPSHDKGMQTELPL